MTLPGIDLPIKLRRRPLEAMTLLWDIQVQWLDVKHKYRLRDSRWYWPWYQTETSSSRSDAHFWETQVQWIDVKHRYRLGDSRRYWHWNHF